MQQSKAKTGRADAFAIAARQIPSIKLDPCKLRLARQSRFPGAAATWVAREHLGISRQQLYSYESGQAVPPGNELLRMMIVYQICPGHLIDEKILRRK